MKDSVFYNVRYEKYLIIRREVRGAFYFIFFNAELGYRVKIVRNYESQRIYSSADLGTTVLGTSRYVRHDLKKKIHKFCYC